MPPIVLKIKGSRPFLPFAELDNEEDLSKTWRVCTKVKDSLENGNRLENLSWRLWHLHQLVASGKNKSDGGRKTHSMSTDDKSTGGGNSLDIKSMHSATTVIRQDGISNMQLPSSSSSFSSMKIMTESKRQTFRTLSKNATRILDGDENADQREFEMRVRQFSPSSTGRSPSASQSPQVTAGTPSSSASLANNNQQLNNTTARKVNINQQSQSVNTTTNSGIDNSVIPAGIAMATTPTANNNLWLQQACAMQTSPMTGIQATATAAVTTPATLIDLNTNNSSNNTSMSMPTHTLAHINQGRAITTTTNTMLPAPSAVYPPYHAYTAGNDLSQLMGAAASMFPQLMGISGLADNAGMINNVANSLTGTAAGVLLDDMFGSFPASAYVGDVNRPPTIEIPLEQVLNANGIDVTTAAVAAAAAATSNW
jgi:hypothetical protein